MSVRGGSVRHSFANIRLGKKLYDMTTLSDIKYRGYFQRNDQEKCDIKYEIAEKIITG